MKRIIVLLLVAVLFADGWSKTKVHTFGDSTCSTYAESTGKCGWGQILQNIFDADLIECHNWAKSGATAATFYKNQYPTAKASISEGDYVIIQFGHNDQKVYTEDLAGPTAYRQNLKVLIDDVRSLGATPILCTSICRNLWTGDEISLEGRHDTREKVNAETMPDGYDYPQVMRDLAAEEGLYLIDMTTATRELFEEIGQGKTTTLFASGDASHTNATGADINTRLFGQLLKSTLPATHELVQALIADNIVVPSLVEVEEYVNGAHIWLGGSTMTTSKGTVTCKDGLYLRGGSKAITNYNSKPTITLPDGTSVSCTGAMQIRPQALTLTKKTTAGCAVTDATGNCLAFNAAVPGTIYVAIRPLSSNSLLQEGTTMNIYFRGNSDEAFSTVASILATDANNEPQSIAMLQYTSTEEGTFFIGSDNDYYVYAVKFVPTPYIDLTWSEFSDYTTFYSSSATYQLGSVALTKDDAIGEVYVMSSIEDGIPQLTKTDDNIVPKGTAVVLKGGHGETYRLMQVADQTYEGANLLRGVDEATTLQPTTDDNHNYLFTVRETYTAFMPMQTAQAIAANTAYLQTTTAYDHVVLSGDVNEEEQPSSESEPEYEAADLPADPTLLENVTGNEAKAGTRWWWMGSAVDAANINALISQYAEAGLGTVEVTPIYGVQGNEQNELSFLSAEWMDALNTTQTAAAANDMDVDMNMGTGWPFGGPEVMTVVDAQGQNADDVQLAAGQLAYMSTTVVGDGTTELTQDIRLTNTSRRSYSTLNKVMAFPQGSNTHAVMELTDKVTDSQTLRWTAPEGDWLIVAIWNSHTRQQVKRAAPGGEGLVLDHFDATSVKNYLKKFEKAFAESGKPYPHAFFNDSYEVFDADWTPRMFEQFEHFRGYKLEEHIDQLLGLGDRTDAGNQVLADYRQTLSDMLLYNFTRQWVEWAHSHGAMVRNQSHGAPANIYDLYAMVDVPEIEGFGLTDFGIKGLRTDAGFTRANYSSFSTLKYASSAAHVTGKRFTSSETFTWLTEHFRTSLSQMKPDMDLMFLAGVNHMLFHGTTYSPIDDAWPGWKFYASVDMSPTNSIWHDAPELLKYIERCQSHLQQGKPDNDLLVYLPFANAWHKGSEAGSSFKNKLLDFAINDLSTKMPDVEAAVTAIETAGLDCDYISDKYLRTTTFANGMLQTAAGQSYKAIVVPTADNLPVRTRQHLETLAEAGATIIYGYAATALAAAATPEPLRTEAGLRTIRRKTDSGYIYFIANLSANDVSQYVGINATLPQPVLYDPMTGESRNALTRDGKVLVSLRSGQSVILLTNGTPAANDYVEVTEQPGRTLSNGWSLTFTADSHPAITDTYSIGTLQPWQTIDEQTSQLAGTGIYQTAFEVSASQMSQANGGFRLNLGDVRESARVYINNVYVGCAWSAPYVLDLGTDCVKEGVNTLRIEVTNLPANRIRQMDEDGVVWRKFKDTNINDILNGKIGVTTVSSYASWALMPSGLNSTVTLIPLRAVGQTELKATLTAMVQEGTDYYPQYTLSLTDGTAITSLSKGSSECDIETVYNGDGTAIVTIFGGKGETLTLAANDNADTNVNLTVRGAYRAKRIYDFTASTAPTTGWTSKGASAMNGFSDKPARYQANASGTSVELYEGLTITSSAKNFFYLFPGYGMNLLYDGTATTGSAEGEIAVMSYLTGTGDAYNADDALYDLQTADNSSTSFSFSMKKRDDNTVYRNIAIYEPQQRYVQLSITEACVATFCSPQPLDFSGTGLSAYSGTMSSDGDRLLLNDVTQTPIPAGEGIIVRGAKGSYDIPVSDSEATTLADNNLLGTLAPVIVGESNAYYAFANGSSGLGFYRVKQGIAIPSGKAYLYLPNSQSRQFVGLADWVTNAIRNVQRMGVTENGYFNLGGQPVGRSTKGIVIISPSTAEGANEGGKRKIVIVK